MSLSTVDCVRRSSQTTDKAELTLKYLDYKYIFKLPLACLCSQITYRHGCCQMFKNEHPLPKLPPVNRCVKDVIKERDSLIQMAYNLIDETVVSFDCFLSVFSL